jgi:hypothetical protein
MTVLAESLRPEDDSSRSYEQPTDGKKSRPFSYQIGGGTIVEPPKVRKPPRAKKTPKPPHTR